MRSNIDSNILKSSRFIEQVQFTLMLALIFLVSYTLFNLGDEQTTLTFMRWYIGIFMLTFSGIKLLDYQMFVSTLR